MTQKYPFKNLVFKGGGVKAFAYHGTVEVLEQYDILNQIERVAGTSAGAIMAALLSFRLSAEKTIELFNTIDYSRITSSSQSEEIFQNAPKSSSFLSGFERVLGGVDALRRFVNQYGIRSSKIFYNWLQELIASNCDGNGDATFLEFRERGFRDLYIVAANLSKKRETIFSTTDTPHVSVADAILMSSSLPLFFEAPQFDGYSLGQGDYYIDGGVLANFPIHLFDHQDYQSTSQYYRHGINWETIGCRLYTPEDCPQEDDSIGNLLKFLENLFDMYATGQEIAIEESRVNQMRTINISNCCVSTTDFFIQPNQNDLKYLELVQSGRKAAIEYLRDYSLPVDRFYNLKSNIKEVINKINLQQK